jgi:phosphatidate cytidylyltransferase
MLTRIIVSIVAIPLIILTILFGKIYFLIFISAVSSIALYEFLTFSKNKNSYPQVNVSLILGLLFIWNVYFSFIDFQILLLLSILLTSLIELFRDKNSAIINLGITYLGILYIPIFLSSLIYLREYDKIFYYNGAYLILGIIVSIWTCDSAAYFVGIKIGKHKIFPRVSPKKSWEGSIAGLISAIIAMVILQKYLLDFITFRQALIMGIVIGVFGQIGDLIESLFKRDAGVKDSSNLIPGHGGFFDRFDSLIFIAPIMEIILKFIK